MSPVPASPLISPARADSGDGLPIQGPSWRRRYAIVLGCVAAALLFRLALDPALGSWLFLLPSPSSTKEGWGEDLPVAQFLLGGAFISWLAGRLRAARQRSEQSEELLSLMIDGAKDHAIFLLDPGGRVRSWNAGAERITGYTSREIIDSHFCCFYPEEEARAGQPEAQLRAAAEQGCLETEGWRRRKDGSLFWASFILNALRDESGRLRGFSTIVRDRTDAKLAQDARRRSDEQARRILDSLPAHVALLDGAGNIIQVNSAWERFARANGDPAFARSGIGTNYLEVCQKAAQQGDELALRVRDGLRRLLDGSLGEFTIEYPCHSPTEPRWFLLHATPLCGERGVVCSHMPITELKRAEEELRQSEERLRLAMEATGMGLWYARGNSPPILDWSARLKEMWGLPAEVEMTVDRSWSLIHPDDREMVRQAVGGALDPGSDGRFVVEHRIRRPDGATRWVQVRGQTTFEGPAGARRPTRSIGIVLDVTERRQADQAVRESQARLQLVADSLPVLIAYIDDEGRYQFNNAAYENWFGLAREGCKGRHIREVIGDAAYEALRGHVEAALAGEPRSFETRVPYQGAGTRDVHVEYVPHRDGDGRVLGFYSLIMDISDRRRAEEALRDSERRFRVLAEHAPIGIFLTDREGLTTYTNPRCQQIYGFGTQEALGQGWSEFIHPEDRERVLGDWLRLASAAKGFSMEYRAIRPDGECRWVHDRAVPLFSERGEVTGHVGTVEDITERKRAEDALREREARLSAILNTAADAIVTIDYQGTIQAVNPAAEKLFGYTPEEMVGRNVTMLMPSPYREEHGGYLDRYLRTGVRRIIGTGREVQALRKDGTTFMAELAVSETAPLRLFTGILRDVSPRKQLEREVLEIAAREQQRIGQELHDSVGQELTGLSLLADTLVERLENTLPAEAGLAAKVLDGLGRLHGQVRALSHGLVPVEVHPDGLRAALEDLAARTEEQSGVRCALACAGPVEVSDSVTATHLFRIAQEAVSNALRHGRPRNIRVALLGEPGTLTLSVQDDGVGLGNWSEEDKGLGIRLMRYRAGTVGGTLTIGPATGGGTVVRCTVASQGHGSQS